MPVVSVFLSSTFRDFHGERDALVGPVRAALDDLLRPWGCRVEVIDLRWGVAVGDQHADAEARQRRILDVCLSEISRSRPLFVGLIGDRYGWVPPLARAQRVAAEAGLGEDVAGRSVTELEFLHGALEHADKVTPVVFVRDLVGDIPPGWRETDVAALARLDALRGRIAAHPGVAMHRYEVRADGSRVVDLSAFEALAVEVLGPVLVARAQAVAADAEIDDPVTAAESLFIADRTTVVAGRDDLLREVTAAVRAGTSVCLSGPSGAGKSALWCTVVDRLRADGVRVAAVPVGAAPGVSSEWVVVARLAAQLGEGIPAHVSTVDQLRDWWRDVLVLNGELVVAVDALDSLDVGSAREELGFLAGLPAGVTLLVSTTLGSQRELLERVDVRAVVVNDLSAAAVAQVATELLASAGRELPGDAVAMLAAQPRSPLWLTLAIGELTALDEDDFTSVDPAADAVAELTRLVTSTVAALPEEVAGLVALIADRAEYRYGADAVAAVLRPAALSRSGLARADLAALTGLTDVVIAGIRRAFAGMIDARGVGGRWGFAHGIVRDALRRRYVPEDDPDLWRAIHAAITGYLGGIADEDPVRQDDQLWHALHSGGDLSAGPVLNEIADAESPRGVRAQWVIVDALISGGIDLSTASSGVDHSGLWVILGTVGSDGPDMPTSHRLALADTAATHARRLLVDDPGSPQAARDVSVSLKEVGRAAREAGQLDRAGEICEESLQIARGLLADDPGSARAANSVLLSLEEVGEVARKAGQLDRAGEVFEESLQIARRIWEDHPGNAQAARDVSISLIQVGRVALGWSGELPRSGELRRAGEVFEESLQIARGLLADDPGSAQAARDVRIALDQVGQVAYGAGQLGRAGEVFEESLQIARGLWEANPGSVQAARGVSHDLGKVGQVALEAGQVGRAREVLEESLQIARGLLADDPDNVQAARKLGVALERVGEVARKAGQPGRAREVFEESLQIARGLWEASPGSAEAASDMIYSLGEVGQVALEAGQPGRAGELFEESLQIARRSWEANPGSAQAASDMRVSLGLVAQLALEEGQLGRAGRALFARWRLRRHLRHGRR